MDCFVGAKVRLLAMTIPSPDLSGEGRGEVKKLDSRLLGNDNCGLLRLPSLLFSRNDGLSKNYNFVFFVRFVVYLRP